MARSHGHGDQSAPERPRTPGSEERALDGYIAVLGGLASAIADTWDAVLEGQDPDALHDFRVAVRRTRSVLAQAKHVLPAAIRTHYRREFGWLAGATSGARDLDVTLQQWNGYVELMGADAEGLSPVLEAFADRRREAHSALARSLQSRRGVELLPGWLAQLAALETASAPPTDAEQSLGSVLAARIDAAQRRLLKQGRALTADTDAAVLHELRKDAKKLRYLLECFEAALPSGPRKKVLKRLKALQTQLGEHQDAVVQMHQMRALAADYSAAPGAASTLLALGRLVQHLEERRLACRAAAEACFRAYDKPSTRAALRELL